jgi:hypothetical protein
MTPHLIRILETLHSARLRAVVSWRAQGSSK